MPFELEFPITRRFNLRWPHFTPIVLTVSALTLIGLTLLNVQLVGFETITRLEDDFNFTQPFWLDRIIPEALSQTKPLSSSLVYKGSTLQDCDITAIYLNGNTNPPSMDIVAVVFCKNLGGFDVIAKTAFPVSVMPGTYTRFTGKLSSFSSVQRILPYQLIYLATSDLQRHVDAIIAFSQAHYKGSLSAEISYAPCPASLGTNAPCAINPPPVDISSALLIISNDTSSVYLYNASGIAKGLNYEAVANIIQTVHAVVQIDLGNFQKNNFLLNSSVLNTTLYSQFSFPLSPEPTISDLYQAISGNFSATLPFKVEGPAKLEARYLCQVQQLKEPAQASIAVLVATLSMFLSVWGLFMLLATYFVKRGNDLANSCIAHGIVPVRVAQAIASGPVQVAHRTSNLG